MNLFKEVFLRNGTPGTTFNGVSNNSTVKTLSDLGTLTKAGQNPVAALITVDDFAVRVAYRVDPTQGGLGHLLRPGDSMWLASKDEIDHLRIITEEGTNHGTVNASLFYDNED